MTWTTDVLEKDIKFIDLFLFCILLSEKEEFHPK